MRSFPQAQNRSSQVTREQITNAEGNEERQTQANDNGSLADSGGTDGNLPSVDVVAPTRARDGQSHTGDAILHGNTDVLRGTCQRNISGEELAAIAGNYFSCFIEKACVHLRGIANILHESRSGPGSVKFSLFHGGCTGVAGHSAQALMATGRLS